MTMLTSFSDQFAASRQCSSSASCIPQCWIELLALLLFSLGPSEGRCYCLVLREGDCNPGPCLSLATLYYKFPTCRS